MTTSALASKPRSAALNVSLWVAQLLLAALFGMGGAFKAFAPFATLAAQVPWVNDVPLALTRFIGAAELAGALGMLLPALTRVKPQLTPLAAAGLAVIMVLAAGFHAMRGEWSHIPVTLVYGGVAAFVAWGRHRKAPIAPRA